MAEIQVIFSYFLLVFVCFFLGFSAHTVVTKTALNNCKHSPSHRHWNMKEAVMELEELPNVPTHDQIVPVSPKKDSPEKARLGLGDVLWMYDCVSIFF